MFSLWQISQASIRTKSYESPIISWFGMSTMFSFLNRAWNSRICLVWGELNDHMVFPQRGASDPAQYGSCNDSCRFLPERSALVTSRGRLELNPQPQSGLALVLERSEKFSIHPSGYRRVTVGEWLTWKMCGCGPWEFFAWRAGLKES